MERIAKFILMIFLTPILVVLMLLITALLLCLPLVVLIAPNLLTLTTPTNKEEK